LGRVKEKMIRIKKISNKNIYIAATMFYIKAVFLKKFFESPEARQFSWETPINEVNHNE